jgi:ribonuclease HI
LVLDVPNLHVCRTLFSLQKDRTPPSTFRGAFLHHIATHVDTVCIYTDGSKTSDGVGFAYVSPLQQYSRRIQDYASVYVAELLAIQSAVRHGCQYPHHTIVVATDSRSAILALNTFRPKNQLVRDIRNQIAHCHKEVFLCWVPSHVGVPGNERADSLARSAIDNEVRSFIPLPRCDLRRYFQRVVWHKWYEDWENTNRNKLKEAKPHLNVLLPSHFPNREWEVKLARLRIGHTQITHEHLLLHSPPKYCQDCLIPLTVRHFLIECPSYLDERRRRFGPGPYNLTHIFTHLSSMGGPLSLYLHDIHLYLKL